MESFLHPDIANIDPKTASPEEIEKLLSDPMFRNLQYQLQNGVRDIKLESNQGERKINNIVMQEGEDQETVLQRVMAEENRNKERTAKEEKRKKEAANAERLKKSDPWVIDVVGAGTEKVNGRYERDGEAVRNGGRVYKGPNGFSFSFECVSGGEGWILGKVPRAFYANQVRKPSQASSSSTPPIPLLSHTPLFCMHRPRTRSRQMRNGWYRSTASSRRLPSCPSSLGRP